MKKKIAGVLLPLMLILCGLSGCHAVGEKAASLSMVYAAAAVLSLAMLVGCCCVVKKKKAWFVLLFSSVLVVNIGYTFLAVSTCLEMALWANRIAYLGSVLLPLSMLMIILNVTGSRYPSWLQYVLGALSMVILLIAASPGLLPIYYKDVSFAVVNGVSTLVKVYGPLHPLYLFYLLGYFAAMVMVIVRASVKKTIDSTAHAVILAIAVFVNIGVWFIEQLVSFDFEMLSVSYIISELFLLGVHLVVGENQRLKELVKQKEEALRATAVAQDSVTVGGVSAEAMECFATGLETLTPTERVIYDAYVIGTSTKEIMTALNIKENTLKFHNKNLYSKLGVSSRKRLVEVYKAIKAEKS